MIPKKLKAKTMKAIMKHAEEGYPKEICGVVVIGEKGERYVPCENIATDPTEEFEICPESYADAEDLGEIVGIVHSHPDAGPNPSNADIAVMSRNREMEILVDPTSKPIPWHIVSWPQGAYSQTIPTIPDTLLNRPFVHNVWDCWTTCEQYYKKYHGLEFRSFQREDRWWEIENTTSFYEEFYEECGFELVSQAIPGDLLIMQIGRTFHPNHAGIYLGKVNEFEGQEIAGGQPIMLHHMHGKLSTVAVYGGQWAERTRMILRHKGVENG